VPKRPHGRPAKARNRARRPASPSIPPNGGVAPAGQDLVAERVPVTTAAAPTQQRAAATAAAVPAASRRGAPAARRGPATIINYQYLRHDLRTLSILAPAMIVVLVILFFLLHY